VSTIGQDAGPVTAPHSVDERGLATSKRRRRPSGQPPALPRELGAGGRFWVGALAFLAAFTIFLLVTQVGNSFERQESVLARWIADWRTGWLNRLALIANGLGSTVFTRTLRLGTIVALIVFRRWRHLIVFVVSALFVAWLINQIGNSVVRPRPFGVRIIGGWDGWSFPSRPVAELSVALVGILYTLIPRGRLRDIGKFVAATMLAALAGAEVYLGLNHPADILFAAVIGIGVPLIAFCFFVPSSSFPFEFG
jgi:membrane-associated phospholipid phosphatase